MLSSWRRKRFSLTVAALLGVSGPKIVIAQIEQIVDLISFYRKQKIRLIYCLRDMLSKYLSTTGSHCAPPGMLIEQAA